MNYRSFLFILLVTVTFFSCQSSSDKKEEGTNADTLAIQLPVNELPELLPTDSIDVHFFPDIQDQKTYTRNSITDSSLIRQLIIAALHNQAVNSTPCEYDTKFFCFANGAFVKTLYLAVNTDSCHFIGYIKSGGITIKKQLDSLSVAAVRKLKLTSYSSAP